MAALLLGPSWPQWHTRAGFLASAEPVTKQELGSWWSALGSLELHRGGGLCTTTLGRSSQSGGFGPRELVCQPLYKELVCQPLYKEGLTQELLRVAVSAS